MKKPNLMFPILILFFFLSGACGLMYEIIWQRMLLLIFGISNFAVATVLSSFMAGLALGSYFFGRKADKIKRPLRLYGLLEIGIALFAFIFPNILEFITSVYTAIHHQFHTTWYLMNLLKFLFCFVVLLIPATLMGGTLPIAVRYIVKSLKQVGNRVGTLYGINTLGAVVGCVAAGFFLISSQGAQKTGYIAAVINLSIGIIVLLLDSNVFSAKVEPLPEKDTKTKLSLKTFPPPVTNLILAVAGISGFCALSYEVLWTRAITFYLQASIYAFPTMLATFLCGSALGTILIIKFADKEKSTILLIGILQLLIGVASVLTIWEFGSIRLFIAGLWATGTGDLATFLSNGFTASFIIMFIPTLFMGMIIPLAVKVYTQSMNNIGGSVGHIYAINTAGAVLGSFITGFALIPLIGVTKGIFAISVLNMVAGAVVLFLKDSPLKIFRYCLVAVSLIFVIGAGMIVIPNKTPIFYNSPYFMNLEAGEKILYYNEGPGATITVRRLSPYVFDNNRYDLIEVNAANVAGTAPGLRVTQKVQGHFPLILYKANTGKDPRFAFILGLGTGESSHCICLHDIEKLDCLELVPGEIKANAQFKEINHDILKNNKFQLTINDARNFLLTATKQYDVLESDAVHPEIDIGTYTKEYFEICKARLSKHGIFSSWIPLFGISEDNFKIMLKTMQDVFPHVMVWYSPQYNSKHALLMGLKTKLRIDFARLKEEMEKDAIKNSLAEIGLDDPYTILSCFLIDEQAISEYTAEAPSNDDDKMILPYNIPKQRLWADKTVHELLSLLRNFSVPVNEYVENYEASDPAFEKRLTHALAIRDHLVEGVGYFFSRDYFNAATQYEMALKLNPNDRHIRYMMDESRFLTCIEEGRRLTAMGALPEASQFFGRALEMNPQSAVAHNELGRLYFMGGFIDPAKERFKKAIDILPDFAQAHFNLAQVSFQKKKYKAARKYCEKALELNPNMKMAKELLEEVKE